MNVDEFIADSDKTKLKRILIEDCKPPKFIDPNPPKARAKTILSRRQAKKAKQVYKGVKKQEIKQTKRDLGVGKLSQEDMEIVKDSSMNFTRRLLDGTTSD